MQAKIFKPARNAMQSGWANTRKWVLVYEQTRPRRIDDLMGYTSSDDTTRQVRLTFDTEEQAVAYAQKHGIPFELTEPKLPKKIIKAYADNFAFGRRIPWTH